jgi:hypothetical protein
MARRLFRDEQDVGEDSITTKKKSLQNDIQVQQAGA